MSRCAFYVLMLAAFLSAGGMSGFVVETATSADAPAAAVEQITVFRVTAGYYVVQGGVIVPFGEQPPVPPVVPPVVPTTDLAKAILAEIAKIPANNARHTAATKLCGVYQVVSSKVDDDTISFSSAAQGVDFLLKPAIGTAAAKTWEPVTNLVEAAMNGCTSKASCLATMNEAASAILSTVPNSANAVEAMQAGKMLGENEEFKQLAKVYGFDWNAFLMMLLEVFLKLLPLIISAVKYGALILIA